MVGKNKSWINSIKSHLQNNVKFSINIYPYRINNKKTNIPEIKIHDVGEFIELSSNIIRYWSGGNKPPYLKQTFFRGVSNEKHELIPSIYRCSTYINNNFPTKIDGFKSYEKQLIDEFSRNFLMIKNDINLYNFLEKNDLFWIIQMQHYGIPTRLLDWTNSSFTGLYFSVRDIEKDNQYDGAVWMIDPFYLNQISNMNMVPNVTEKEVKNWKNWKKDNPIAILPISFDKRISNQNSYFTIHGNNTDSIEKILAIKKEPRIVKFIINKANRAYIRDSLITSGIRESTLFPDLEGLARDIKYDFDLKW